MGSKHFLIWWWRQKGGGVCPWTGRIDPKDFLKSRGQIQMLTAFLFKYFFTAEGAGNAERRTLEEKKEWLSELDY